MNYYTSCGDNNSSQWTANYQHGDCFLYTPILNPIGTGQVNVDYSFRINQAGNNTEYDTLKLEFTIENGWQVIHTVLGDQYNEVNNDIQGVLSDDTCSYIAFRLHAIVHMSNSFWAIKKDNTNFTVNNVTPTSDFVLHVKLDTFSGRVQNNHALLEWTSCSETNNESFVIEKSDNNNNYYPVGIGRGASNSNSQIEYSFTDPEQLISEITYYRLSQTDYDGSVENLSTIAVKKQSYSNQQIWCVEEQSTVQIYYNTNREEQIVISIYDANGRCIDTFRLSAMQGLNSYHWSSSAQQSNCRIFLITIIDSSSRVHSAKVMM